MTTQTLIYNAQYRLAQHYLEKLRQAETVAWLDQRNRTALINRVMQDWAQIKRWQAWSAAWSETEREKAALCIAFPLATSSFLRVQILPSETLVWLRQALQAANTFEDREAELRLLYLVCLLYANMESYGEVAPYLEQLLEGAYIAEDDLSLGRAWLISGRKHEFEGDFDTAESLYLQSLELIEQLHADEEMVSVWQGLGRIALQRGDYQKSLERHLKLLEYTSKLGREGMVAISHLSLSGIYISLYDYPASEAHAQQAVAIGRRIGYAQFIPAALVALAHAQKWLYKLDKSCLHYEEALRQRDLLAPSTVISALYGWAQANFRQHDLEQAFAHLDEALRISLERQILFRRCEVLEGVVIVHAARHEIERARERLRELVDCSLQLGTPPYAAKVFSAAVILWHESGESKQAALWAGVLTAYLDHIDPIWFDTAVFEELEKVLGSAPYQYAVEEGRALSLSAAFEALTKTLIPSHDGSAVES